MASDKTISCDCGYRVRAATEERQVGELRAHAWTAHGVAFSVEEALGVLLRLELELDRSAWAGGAIVEDTTTTKEDA